MWAGCGPGRPLKVLAAYGKHLTLEGPDVEGVVIAEFPTLDEARDWYESPADQEAAQHRHRGAVYRGLIVEGYKMRFQVERNPSLPLIRELQQAGWKSSSAVRRSTTRAFRMVMSPMEFPLLLPH